MRTTSRANRLERVPPSPYFQSALLRNTLDARCRLLWAERRKPRLTSTRRGAVPLPRPEVAGLGSHVSQGSCPLSVASCRLSALSVQSLKTYHPDLRLHLSLRFVILTGAKRSGGTCCFPASRLRLLMQTEFLICVRAAFAAGPRYKASPRSSIVVHLDSPPTLCPAARLFRRVYSVGQQRSRKGILLRYRSRL